jgi:hypothetical protein
VFELGSLSNLSGWLERQNADIIQCAWYMNKFGYIMMIKLKLGRLKINAQYFSDPL